MNEIQHNAYAGFKNILKTNKKQNNFEELLTVTP